MSTVKAEPNYERVVWREGKWVAEERGANLHALKAHATGSPGDDWSIRCVRHGNLSCFYGCGLCAREELAR